MENKNRALVIGITGGIGSGKTSVAKIIAEMGYKVLIADDQAKKIMSENEAVKAKIIDTFGNETYLSDGSLNRTFLAGLVFGDDPEKKSNLDKLNKIVHPAVIDDMIEMVEKYENEGEKIIFKESALIYEAGLADGFDYIISVYADEENCIKRVADRNGSSSDEVKKRMESQLSPQFKRDHADFVIDNNGNPEDLKNSTQLIVSIVSAMPPRDLTKENDN